MQVEYLTLDDEIKVDEATISRAKKNVEIASYEIGWKYHQTRIQYSKAMAWYRLTENQNDSAAYTNIGLLYSSGLGVTRHYHIALEYYLKAVGINSVIAMVNIASRFLIGKGVPVNKYKVLEWYIKCRSRPEYVKRLDSEGVHLKEEDKNKTVHQLMIETEDIIQERKKKNEEYQVLKKLNAANEEELTNQQNEIQKLQNESQQKQQRINILEQKEQQVQLRIDSLEQQSNTEKEQLKQLNSSLGNN